MIPHLTWDLIHRMMMRLPSAVLGCFLGILGLANPPAVAGLSEIKLPRRLLVLAPHPDDVLLSAGLIQRVRSQGGQVEVLNLTSGDGNSPFGYLYARRQGFKKQLNPALNYGLYRQMEDFQAVSVIGLPHSTLLGYPDSGLWEMLTRSWRGNLTVVKSDTTRVDRVPYANAFRPGAPYLYSEIVKDMSAVMDRFHPDAIIAPHPNDHHTDHAATYYFAQMALIGSKSVSALTPIYTPLDEYAEKLPLRLNRNLVHTEPTAKIPSPTRWSQLKLTNQEIEAKIKMTSKYPSQMVWEHPFKSPYLGTDSYMYGYVAQNELYGEVQTVIEDAKFRSALNHKIRARRGWSVPGRVLHDLF